MDLPDDLSGGQEIRYVAGVYLRSGEYVAAVAVDDATVGKRNLWRGRIQVPELPNGLLAWEEHFPQVEGVGYFSHATLISPSTASKS